MTVMSKMGRQTGCNMDTNNNIYGKKQLLPLYDQVQYYGSDPSDGMKSLTPNYRGDSTKLDQIRKTEDKKNSFKSMEEDKKSPTPTDLHRQLDEDYNKSVKALNFNGENWSAFIKTFDRLLAKAHWSDEVATWKFRFTMKDKAVDVWGKLEDTTQESYTLVRAQFQKLFGVCDNPSVLRQRLLSLKQGDRVS